MKQIAFFDFDGTITTKDTLLEVIRYQKGSFRFYAGFLLNSPYLFAYKAGIISNQLAKEKVLAYFFRKTNADQFQQQCDEFARQVLPALIRPKALKEIQLLKERGVEVVIVSASAANWISHWCSMQGVSLLATKLETRSLQITGKIEGKNCHGEEKVRRICEAYNLSEYTHINCYGDTKGDKPMLSLGTVSFYKPFR